LKWRPTFVSAPLLSAAAATVLSWAAVAVVCADAAISADSSSPANATPNNSAVPQAPNFFVRYTPSSPAGLGTTTSGASPNPSAETSLLRPLPIPSAVQFKVVLKTPIDSRRDIEGQPIKATLKDDLVYDDRVVAEAGSELIGHIEHLRKSRRMLKAMASNDGRFIKSGSMTIVFDELSSPHNEHFSIIGMISQQHTMQESGRYPRELKVGKHGDINKAEEVFSTGDQIISQVLNFTLQSGLGPLGTVASFGAAPILLGALGAIEPDTAYLKPVSEDEKHPRLKGFALGATSSLPGYQAIQVFGFKGDDLKLRVGDEFMVQVHAPYHDIVAADGALIPQESFDSLSVQATVVPKEMAVREKIHY